MQEATAVQEKPRMNRMQAVRTFFSKDSRKPVETTEMAELWKGLDEKERAEFAGACATQLGVEIG